MANRNNVPDYIDEQDYEYILNSYLGNVRDDVDKREGSIIWDSGAPCCIEIAKAYLYLQAMILNCFARTAMSPYLELRCEEQGITREPATYARRLGIFTNGEGEPYPLVIGQEFSTVSETNLVNFKVISVYTEDGQTVPGSYILQCTQPGTIGNEYFGEIVPLNNLDNLATANLSDILVPGEAIEDIEVLRQRYFDSVKTKAFGGNIAQYREFITSIDGVGTCQVYPVWDGGGTVKISFIDSSYNRASSLLVQEVQEKVDPHWNDDYAGKGLGQAPIGHVVTVVTPDNNIIDIECDLTLKNGVTLPQVEPDIIANIEEYFLSVRKEWAISTELNEYSCNIRIARIQSAILNTYGVDNVSNCKLNGQAQDIILTENETTQELPIKGEITLNVQ